VITSSTFFEKFIACYETGWQKYIERSESIFSSWMSVLQVKQKYNIMLMDRVVFEWKFIWNWLNRVLNWSNATFGDFCISRKLRIHQNFFLWPTKISFIQTRCNFCFITHENFSCLSLMFIFSWIVSFHAMKIINDKNNDDYQAYIEEMCEFMKWFSVHLLVVNSKPFRKYFEKKSLIRN